MYHILYRSYNVNDLMSQGEFTHLQLSQNSTSKTNFPNLLCGLLPPHFILGHFHWWIQSALVGGPFWFQRVSRKNALPPLIPSVCTSCTVFLHTGTCPVKEMETDQWNNLKASKITESVKRKTVLIDHKITHIQQITVHSNVTNQNKICQTYSCITFFSLHIGGILICESQHHPPPHPTLPGRWHSPGVKQFLEG
jgi:hypothetical protein